MEEAQNANASRFKLIYLMDPYTLCLQETTEEAQVPSSSTKAASQHAALSVDRSSVSIYPNGTFHLVVLAFDL